MLSTEHVHYIHRVLLLGTGWGQCLNVVIGFYFRWDIWAFSRFRIWLQPEIVLVLLLAYVCKHLDNVNSLCTCRWCTQGSAKAVALNFL